MVIGWSNAHMLRKAGSHKLYCAVAQNRISSSVRHHNRITREYHQSADAMCTAGARVSRTQILPWTRRLLATVHRTRQVHSPLD